jgi:hypothetical protein
MPGRRPLTSAEVLQNWGMARGEDADRVAGQRLQARGVSFGDRQAPLGHRPIAVGMGIPSRIVDASLPGGSLARRIAEGQLGAPIDFAMAIGRYREQRHGTTRASRRSRPGAEESSELQSFGAATCNGSLVWRLTLAPSLITMVSKQNEMGNPGW